MNRVLAFCLCFFEMECGVGGGKAYSNYIINVEIARYSNFRFRSCSFAIRVCFDCAADEESSGPDGVHGIKW